MNSKMKGYELPKFSFKTQTIATLITIVAAVLLPQVLHMAGAAMGVQSTLGEIFLPMHLPIMLLGFLAGPVAGAVAGLCAPLISFALTGMPGAAMLPFITIELVVYGISIGLLRNTKMPTIAKVLTAQVSGRLVRAVAILLVYVMVDNMMVAPSVILTSVRVGFAGILIQLLLLPFFVMLVGKRK